MPEIKKNQQLTENQLVKAFMYADNFIENYCKIEVTGKGLQPFKLFPYQKKVLSIYESNQAIFALKSRQLGFTTLAAAYGLWTSMKEGQSVLFLSKKEDDAMDIVRKTKIMYDNLPDQLKIPLTQANATTLEFSNKNRIESLPASERAGAGKSAYLIILDEFSGFPGAKASIPGTDVWRAIYPTISTGGRVIVQSTPKGMGNKFYQLWAEENNMKKIKVLWNHHPSFGKGLRTLDKPGKYGAYESPWSKKMCANMTAEDWAQEFNGDFLQSGRPVFDQSLLKKHEVEDIDLSFDSKFVCAVDLASGSSIDWHVAQFFNVATGKQVHTMRSQDSLDVFGVKVMQKCTELNEAVLCFENNAGWGNTFMREISDYPNLYKQKSFDTKYQKTTEKLGWNTNGRTKPMMVSGMILGLEQEEMKLTDQKTIDECTTYQYDDNDATNAMAGFNDDCVTSAAIAWQVVLEQRKFLIDVAALPYRPLGMGRISPTVNSVGLIENPDMNELFFPKNNKKKGRYLHVH
jgi:hypothetical protein